MAEKIDLELRAKGNANKFVKDLDNSLKKTNSTFKIFAGNLAANLVTQGLNRIAASASKLARIFSVDAVKAAEKQQNALNELNTALKRSGEFTDEVSKDIEKFAARLEKTTTVGDETVLSLVALSKAFGFTAEQAKVATEAAIQLSAAAGISLEEATRRVGRTISGSTADVSKFAAGINNLTKEQLAAGLAANELLNALRGTAEAQTQTFTGATEQAANAFGTLQEEIGQVVVQNPAVINAINLAADAFLAFSESVKTNQQNIAAAIGAIISGLLESIREVLEGVTVVTEVFGLSFKEAIKSIKEAEIELEESTAEALVGIVAKREERKVAAVKKGNKAIVKSEALTSEQRIAQIRSSLSTISTLQQTATGELFEVGKAAAVAESIIAGFLAVSNTLKLGFPLGFALAPLVATAAALQTAKIASAKPPQFQFGTDFVTGPAGVDQVPARLTQGERVITVGQNQDLTSFLANGGNRDVLVAILGAVSRPSSAPVVQIGSKDVVDAVNDGLDAGLVLNTA